MPRSIRFWAATVACLVLSCHTAGARTQSEPDPRVRIRRLVTRYAEHLQNYVAADTGALSDPYETTYGEGYGPACAAVVAARAFRWTGEPHFRELADRMLTRSTWLVAHPQTDNTAFTHLFLLYYSLLAYEDLGNALSSVRQTELESQFRTGAHGWAPGNANGLAMALCYDLNRHLLGLGQVDWIIADQLITRLEDCRTDQGFVNDAFDADAYPIAYNLFTSALLSDTIELARRYPTTDERVHALLVRLTKLRDGAAAWSDSFVAADGSLTMAERSRDECFTCGAFLFVSAARGFRAGAHLAWWERFARPDGTISITPNHFPHALRVGFESYSDVSMYNGLGFAYLARAERLLSELNPRARDLPHRDGIAVDVQAGYAQLRFQESSVGLALRRHKDSPHGGYAPAGGLLNLSLGGSTARPLASPSYRFAGAQVERDSRDGSMPCRGVFDGFLVRRGKEWFGPDWTSDPRVTAEGAGIQLGSVVGPVEVTKHVALGRDTLSVRYEFTALQDLDEIQVQFPLLVSDGATETSYRIRGNHVFLGFGSDQYRLALQPENASWRISRVVYLTSSSGAVRQLSAQIASGVPAQGKATCTLVLERLPR